MNIKKFSEVTGLTPRAIRFYEEKGILKSQRDVENKYRVFRQDQVSVAKKINHFRQLGFSIEDIAVMLKASPALSLEVVQKNIKANLKKLQKEKAATEKRIQATEALLDATQSDQTLSAKQKNLFYSMAYSDLHEWSMAYVESCLKEKSLGPDAQLQMVACAYADLVLKAQEHAPYAEFANAHRLIAKTLKKINEAPLSKRHEKLAEAYDNLHRDPHYNDLPV